MSNTSTKTSWILELIDKVTAPMRTVDKSTSSVDKTIRRVTASLDDMDDTARASANQAIKSFNDLQSEIKQEERQLDSLNKRLKDLGKNIDPLLKAEIDFDIRQAETKIRRYKEQLVEVQHELEDIEKAPNPAKLKANWGAAVVIANQTVELVNKAIDGMAFTTEIEDLRANIQRMSGESGDQLDSLVSKAYKLGSVFKENPEEIAKAANAMTKMLGGTYEENLSLIEAGFEKGANINGDFIDQLKEYPTFIRQLGLTQSQAIALMAKAGKDGIFSDKAIDSIKEADLSLRELGQPQIDALKAIGIEAKDLAGKTTFEAVQMISKSMEGATTQAKQLVLADIFKGAGEDAGLAWIEGLGSVDLDINNIPSVEAAGSSIRGWLADLQTSFSNTFGGIGSSVVELAPVVTGIASMIPIMSQLTKVTWLQDIATKAMTLTTKFLGITIMGTPIGWILGGIALMIGAITWLSSNVEGWGDAWKHTWEGAKLLFQAFVAIIQAHWNTLMNGIMIGFNLLKTGWLNLQILIGKGNKEQHEKELKQIEEENKARTQSIIDGYKKAAELGEKAKNEFLLAGGSLKIKEGEKETETSGSIPQPGDFTTTLDGKVPDKNKNTSGLQGSAKGMVKSVNMTLTINNHFKVADAAASKIDKIADMVTGRVNDRLRDVMLSV